MSLFHLLMRESTVSPWQVLFLAAGAGISNALVLVLINTVTEQSQEDSKFFYVVLFLVVMAVYLVSQKYLLTVTIHEVDRILHKIRLRIVNKIRSAELLSLEQIGRAEIYAGISNEMLTISNASLSIAALCQSLILIVFTLGYIAWLSFMALVFFLVGITAAVGYYYLKMRGLSKDIHHAIDLENELFGVLTHLLDGFKEVKMSQLRSADLNAHLSNISTAVMEVKGTVTSQMTIASIFGQSLFYCLSAAIVFLLPVLGSAEGDTLVHLSAGVLFLTGPIVSLVGLVQTYTTANVAAENIENLELALDRHVRPATKRRARRIILRQNLFDEITFERVQFEYPSTDGHVPFRLGPLNLSISRGETIFVTGGNGSGKSTFLRLLTCLYFPTKGVIRLDRRRLSEANAETYRDLFSVIFYDYHLFDRLYGLSDVDPQQVEALLEQFQLSGVTGVVGDRFETLNLSSGQKRRLALLVSTLENKPICVFDEWAAEQDPDFRRYFYTDTLAELKAQGKTLIVVTHDDHYYHMDYIDRIIKLQEGQIVSEG